MSILHRRRAVYRRAENRRPAVPAWAELINLDDGDWKALAERHGIEPGERMETLSALNKLRGENDE